MLEAFGADGVLDREFALAEISPVLRFPAAQAISFHFIDYVVHGWDVARSLGVAYQPEPDLLAAALPVALAVPGGQARKRDGAAFDPGSRSRPRPAGPDRRDAGPPPLLAPVRPSWPQPKAGLR